MHCVDLGESFQTHSLNYFLAKFGFDTAENAPSKVWPIAAIRSFSWHADHAIFLCEGLARVRRDGAVSGEATEVFLHVWEGRVLVPLSPTCIYPQKVEACVISRSLTLVREKYCLREKIEACAIVKPLTLTRDP